MQVEINGISVNYDEYGQGNDYIFVLHGWGCSCKVYESIGRILQSKYHVIIPDLPGFGNTPEPPTGWNNSDYANFVVSFIESFHCHSCDLIGHSFGTRLMIRMSVNENIDIKIKSMVFIDGAGILSKDIKKYMNEYHSFKMLKEKFIKENNIKELNELKKKAEGDYAYLSDVMSVCYENTVNDDLTSYLKDIQVSTLLIWGAEDKETPLEDGKLMESLIPDSGLVILPNARHYSFLDQPYIFKRVLESFFSIN